MQGILKVRLSEGDVHRTGCPFVGCSCRLSLSEAQHLLSKQQRERFEQLLAQNYADTNPAIKWCASRAQHSSVGTISIFKGSESKKIARMEGCTWEFWMLRNANSMHVYGRRYDILLCRRMEYEPASGTAMVRR